MTAQPFVDEPDVQFRGTREYIHSTDIYNQIIAGATQAGLAVAGPMDLRIIGRISCKPRYYFEPQRCSSQPLAAATCTFVSRAVDWCVALVESNEPVTGRRPYDESPAATLGHLTSNAIEISETNPLTPIEAVTALAVVLHKSLMPPPTGMRWMLAQLQLARPLLSKDSSYIRVTLDRKVAKKMTKSIVSNGSSAFGSMIFVLSEG